jgi:hypothetical protein
MEWIPVNAFAGRSVNEGNEWFSPRHQGAEIKDFSGTGISSLKIIAVSNFLPNRKRFRRRRGAGKYCISSPGLPSRGVWENDLPLPRALQTLIFKTLFYPAIIPAKRTLFGHPSFFAQAAVQE